MHVLIEEGASAFTLRRIAQQCGLSVGNVNRHFPRKEMLVQVLLEELLSPNEGLIKRNIHDTGMSPEDALALVITGSLDQIKSKSMTHLLIELWAMANHNEFVAERVEDMDRYVHELIASLVAQLNPALSPKEVKAVSVFINASIEGTTVLTGFGKPWSSLMPQMKVLAVRSLVQFAKTITPEEMRSLPQGAGKPKRSGRRPAAPRANPLSRQDF
jgi:AcrR family transcriptional regulator